MAVWKNSHIYIYQQDNPPPPLNIPWCLKIGLSIERAGDNAEDTISGLQGYGIWVSFMP